MTDALPRMTVDPETGAVYVYLAEGERAETVELLPDVVLADVTADGRLLGIEVLR